MKELQTIHFDAEQCGRELEAFKRLLDSRTNLSERDDILPFFHRHLHLSAFLASYHPNITRRERLIGFEYKLFGDFGTDFIVGDPSSASFLFVEFEDAAPSSVFSRSSRSLPAWSPRFGGGFSQVVDWFWKLAEFQHTPDFSRKFGLPCADFMALVVIGRSADLERRERERLQWFRRNVVVHSKHVYCCTFDELYHDLRERYHTYVNPARVAPARAEMSAEI